MASLDTMRRGPWIEEEDERLVSFVNLMGERRWDSIARVSGLRRSGKSCRLRWLNYLRPHLKHGQMSAEEENIILQLQGRWGNKWSKIARRLPGRTDNEIKNYWRTYLRKKSQAQNQENLRTEVENMMNTRDDKSSQTSNAPTEEYVIGTSDYAFLTSPYEKRICDWISETVDTQEYNMLDSWLSDPACPSGDGQGWTDILWDMETSS